MTHMKTNKQKPERAGEGTGGIGAWWPLPVPYVIKNTGRPPASAHSAGGEPSPLY